MMEVGCVVSRDRLPEARVLASTLARIHPDWPLNVLLLPAGTYVPGGDEPFSIVEPGQLGEFASLLAADHGPESSLSIAKPALLRHLLRQGANRVLLLEADAEILSDLTPLEAALDDHEVVLLPRASRPLPEDGERPDAEDLRRAGKIDDGVVAVRSGTQGARFLEWWIAREQAQAESAARARHSRSDLLLEAVKARLPRAAAVSRPRLRRITESLAARTAGGDDRPAGARPLDLAEDLFPTVGTPELPGLNVSYWNLHERSLAGSPDAPLVGAEPVRIMRFTGFRADRPWWLCEHVSRVEVLDNSLLAGLCGRHAKSLREAGWTTPT